MPIAFIGPFTVEQYGQSVTVSLQWYGSSVQAELHRSFYGHLIGLTAPPEDEPAANYAFNEAVAAITLHTASLHNTQRGS